LEILNSARAKLKTVVKTEEKPRVLSPLELTLQKRFLAMQVCQFSLFICSPLRSRRYFLDFLLFTVCRMSQ
jgi:hypothetical protein